MQRAIISLSAILALSACATDQALVTGFNGDSVEIQTSQFGGEVAAKNAQSEANRLCGMRGFRGAEYASTRMDNYNYVNHNLFICTNQTVTATRSGSYFDSL